MSMKHYVDSNVLKPLKANDKALNQLKKSLTQIQNYLTQTGMQMTEVTKSQQVHATAIIKGGLDFDKNVENSLRNSSHNTPLLRSESKIESL